jgi:hypothetical protein
VLPSLGKQGSLKGVRRTLFGFLPGFRELGIARLHLYSVERGTPARLQAETTSPDSLNAWSTLAFRSVACAAVVLVA